MTTIAIAPAKIPRALLALAVLCGAAGAAQARPVHYRCTGYLSVDAEFTPVDGHIALGGKEWRLRRVRDDRQARYVGVRGARVTVLLVKDRMTLVQDGKPLQCELVTDGLAEFTPASAPQAGAAPAAR